jgi:hypothetical protein
VLRDGLFLSVPEGSSIGVATVRMAPGFPVWLHPDALRLVIFVAIPAFAGVRVSASLEGIHTDMQQEMISLILANDKVVVAVVVSDLVHVMDDGPKGQEFPDCLFCNQDMFPDVALTVGPRMSGEADTHVSVSHKPPALPLRIVLCPSIMSVDKPGVPTFAIPRLHLSPAAALTEGKVINVWRLYPQRMAFACRVMKMNKPQRLPFDVSIFPSCFSCYLRGISATTAA